ncbi:hypothetical protein [Halomonas sp. N3-2A]|uniref:hypothetical protein n=1 Tax=Halomonas sp. N3-2A TaxID=2014541 RepID=UPI0012FE6AEF|nr:hypothetical protein [Halomonas sp. N3-2A]
MHRNPVGAIFIGAGHVTMTSAQSPGYWHELCSGGGIAMVFMADADFQIGKPATALYGP